MTRDQRIARLLIAKLGGAEAALARIRERPPELIAAYKAISRKYAVLTAELDRQMETAHAD